MAVCSGSSSKPLPVLHQGAERLQSTAKVPASGGTQAPFFFKLENHRENHKEVSFMILYDIYHQFLAILHVLVAAGALSWIIHLGLEVPWGSSLRTSIFGVHQPKNHPRLDQVVVKCLAFRSKVSLQKVAQTLKSWMVELTEGRTPKKTL